MGTIHKNDIIFATLIQHGSHIASYRLSGLTSPAEIIRQLRRLAGNITGVVTLQLRNGSQGWTHRRSCTLAAPLPEAVQLSLF